jgi:lysophospholipase L1-like esterase
MLATLRALQPHALLVAITPIASGADPAQARAPYSLEQLREAQLDCVAQRRRAGDAQLHVLRGEILSRGAALVDGIHLGIDGAAAHADKLAAALAPLARQHRRHA